MVWKDNSWIDDSPTSFEKFMNDKFPLLHFKDMRDLFHLVGTLYEKSFPKHFIFGNFQCLRCGLCCKNYEAAPIDGEDIKKWLGEGRDDILKHISWRRFEEGFIFAEVTISLSCPFCRKVRGKPYYSCKIHDANKPTCDAYLCSKSLPVAHLDYKDVDELIEIIGLDHYYALIEKEWGEEFDWSKCDVKTHAKCRSID